MNLQNLLDCHGIVRDTVLRRTSEDHGICGAPIRVPRSPCADDEEVPAAAEAGDQLLLQSRPLGGADARERLEKPEHLAVAAHAKIDYKIHKARRSTQQCRI